MMQTQDLYLYEQRSSKWWSETDRTFRSLRQIQQHRLELIRVWIPEISSLNVVDVGCGGGFLSVPLSLSGARVVGVDTSSSSLNEARSRSASTAQFVCADAARLPLAEESADCVLLADILEHIPDWKQALAEAARVLKPGGYCYVSTINRTWQSALLAVVLAEGVGLIPRRTHDPRMFIRPFELRSAARACSLVMRAKQGESIKLWPTIRDWSIQLAWSAQESISYCALLQKL